MKLSGRITVHGGEKTARSAVVELHNAAGDVVDQVMVDDEGRYTYHVSPGSWTLNVWDEHGHRGRAEVTMEEGKDKSFDVDLEEPEGGH